MKNPETRFIEAVHDQLPPRRQFYRLKNEHRHTYGVADVWYSGQVSDLWVEYKWLTIRKQPTALLKLGLTDHQLDWLRERYSERRHVCVIAGHQFGQNKFGAVFVNGAWNNNTVYQSELVAHSYPVRELAQWLMDQCHAGFYEHSVKPIGASSSAFKLSSVARSSSESSNHSEKRSRSNRK